MWRRAEATLATGTAEREAAAAFSQRLPKGATLGADKGYDAEAFVEGFKARGIEPHIAINGTVSKHGKARKTAVPSEVAASVRYAPSASGCASASRKASGWTKTVGGLTQVKVRGLAKVRAAFVLAMAAYNIALAAQALGPEGRSPASDMKSQRTTTRLRRQNSEPEPHPAVQKIALALLVAQTH